jgi:nitroreductase
MEHTMSASSLIDDLAAVSVADAIYDRRAVRAYTADKVGERALRTLLDAAVHAPTAMHQEPWRFVIVQDRALLQRLSDRAKEMARDAAAHHGNLLKPAGAAGDGLASPLADPEFNIFYDAGTLVVIGAKPVNDFVAADCWLAAENLMLAAHAGGLGTCCIGFAVPVLNVPDVKAELGIPADVQAIAPIIVGVPRGEARVVPRKSAVVLNWIR